RTCAGDAPPARRHRPSSRSAVCRLSCESRIILAGMSSGSVSTKTTEGPRRGPAPPDLSEKGGKRNGEPQRSNERLFMQFMAFGQCHDAHALVHALEHADMSGVLYEDVNDPHGVGLLTLTQDPNEFIDKLRRLLNVEPFASLEQKPEFTMLGRTYSLGYEPD